MGLLWLYLPFLCKHQGVGVVGLDTYTWGIKDFHKCWSGSLAKSRLCLGPTSVRNCTPLSALSFWVSLFPRTRGYNKDSSWFPLRLWTDVLASILLLSFFLLEDWDPFQVPITSGLSLQEELPHRVTHPIWPIISGVTVAQLLDLRKHHEIKS